MLQKNIRDIFLTKKKKEYTCIMMKGLEICIYEVY